MRSRMIASVWFSTLRGFTIFLKDFSHTPLLFSYSSLSIIKYQYILDYKPGHNLLIANINKRLERIGKPRWNLQKLRNDSRVIIEGGL